MTIAARLKSSVRSVLSRAGYELVRRGRPASAERPVGSMRHLLEDLRGRGLSCTSILDVGANQCHWSQMAADVFPRATLTLVEPQLEMQPHLDAFCRLAPTKRRYVLAAASSERGLRTLHVAPDLAGSSLLAPPDPGAPDAVVRREVPTIRLDDIIEAPPELVKLDIQGHELGALAGAPRILETAQVLILEVSFFEFLPGQPTFREVHEFLDQRGYCVYDFGGFLRRPWDGALGQADISYVRKVGPFRLSHAWA